MEQTPARIAGATNNTLTFVVYTDTISLSATNAAGGTRVIGVGCRYYTTPERGVFIAECKARSNLCSGESEVVTCAIYTSFVGLRGLYHLCK